MFNRKYPSGSAIEFSARCLLALLLLFALPASAEEYRLGPDDVVSVSVLRHPDMGVDGVTIPSSGRIQLPVAGEIFVAGKTTAQVAREISKAIKVRILNPSVTVSLRQQRPRRVFLLGAVSKPGVIELKPGWRVSEALTSVGGLTTARPEQVDGVLSRPKQKPVVLNVPRLLDRNNDPSNIVLKDGDTLRFTERIMRVTVAGQVVHPGAYLIPNGSNLVEAIAQAGGATEHAALTRVSITHADNTTKSVDLYAASVGGQDNVKYNLRAGDTVMVPESRLQINVSGAVLKPGPYNMQDGRSLRVSEAVALAGGLGQKAALTKAVVRHADNSETPIDLYKVTVLGLKEDDLMLADGDSVVVPESRGVTVLGAVQKPGNYYIQEGSEPRVADLLGQAGGLSIKPELARIVIARAASAAAPAVAPAVAPATDPSTVTTASDATTDNKVATDGKAAVSTTTSSVNGINAVGLLELTDPDQNERVHDGDIITVSTVKLQTVFVSGEVKTPGAYEMQEGESVPELIARAGGPTPLAALRQVKVTMPHGGPTRNVDVFDDVKGGGTGKKINLPLQDGAYVTVPQNLRRVLVMAGVKQAGMVTMPEDRPLTVGEAIGLAGGTKDRAKLTQVGLMRETPNGVQRQVLDLGRVQGGRSALNIVLQNHDIVYVPEGKQVTSSVLETVARSLGPLSLLF